MPDSPSEAPTTLEQRVLERTRELVAESEESRSQFAAVFNAVADGIVVTDMNGRFIIVNESEARMTGYPNPEAMKQDLAYYIKVFELSDPQGNVIPVEDWPLSKVLRGESVSKWELRGRRRDTGQAWWFSFSGEPVRDETGRQTLAVIITRDITSEKDHADALRASEEQLRQLANAIPQLAWIAHADGHIFWYNRRWYEYTGTTPAEMEGWGWKTVHDPSELPRVMGEWTGAITAGEPVEMTFPLRAKDGAYRWFLTRVTPLKDAAGKVVRWCGTNTDIDELRRTEEKLASAIRARDQFLSIASHELRTPLTSLQLHAQSLLRMLDRDAPRALSEAQVRKVAEQTARQVARLSRLVDDMLDISRIGSGKLALDLAAVDLAALAEEVVERLRPQLVAKNGAVRLVIETGSEVESKAIGHWDRFRLDQVLTNLLTNAMRYGGGKPIEVGVQRRGDIARLWVRDHGLGIASEHHARIFERFERAISANEVSGLGLGLYIAEEIVEAHGGVIGVESEVGQGATFSVELPVGDGAVKGG